MDYTQGFQNFKILESPIRHRIIGKIPAWLKGTYLRNGPGQFQFAGQTVQHWFDGLSLINQFQFLDQEVHHQSTLLETSESCHVKKKGTLLNNQFGTHSVKTWSQKLQGFFRQTHFTDNTSVHLIPLEAGVLTLTETPPIHLIHPHTLKTLKSLVFHDDLQYHVTTAHPEYDPHTQKLLNLGIKIGIRSAYQLFEIDLKAEKRRLLCSIPVKNPAYQHSFAYTPNYIILIECPYRLNPLSFFFAMKGWGPVYHENYHWQPEQGTKFIVINRNTQSVVNEIYTDAFFMFHTANCYEQGGIIEIDVMVYQDPKIIQALTLKCLEDHQPLPSSALTHFSLNLKTNRCVRTFQSQGSCELPRYHDRYQGRPYQYLYSTGWKKEDAFMTTLIKWDLKHQTEREWQELGCYPGEPLFVNRPNAVFEDDGIVLSIVLDTRRKLSFLLLLEATSWIEIARVELSFILPFGLHGNFVKNPSDTLGH